MDLPGCKERRHIARVRRYLLLVAGISSGCSSSPLMLPGRPTLAVFGAAPVDARPRGTLYRDEVQRAIQAGLGHFLQHVDVLSVPRDDDGGRRPFVGFEIIALRPAKDWLKFDFAPGDIVTTVDGVSVEHYERVIPMFEALAAKDKFEVSLIRAGEPKTVVVSIVPRPSAASGTTAPRPSTASGTTAPRPSTASGTTAPQVPRKGQ
jgi:hypothetical protein